MTTNQTVIHFGTVLLSVFVLVQGILCEYAMIEIVKIETLKRIHSCHGQGKKSGKCFYFQGMEKSGNLI